MLRVNVAQLREFPSWRVMAVNNTWELVPWAHALYAGDLQWWEKHGERAIAFAGEKWTCSPFAARRHGLRHVKAEEGFGLCRTPGRVNTGGNSGFQAVNLAWHFGARQIVLLGFDMHRNNGAHWHGEHEGMMSAPDSHIAIWRSRFEALADDLRDEGVQVMNCTPGSALECFPRMDLGSALAA